jgi:thiamine biosynthesis lipoprotein
MTAALMTGCGKKEVELKRYEATFLQLFDTVTTIVGYAKSSEEFSEFAQEVHDELEIYHRLYDIYNDYEGINNIKTINDNAGKSPVKVDQRIIDLIEFASEAEDLSGGKINIAYGAVLKVWHEYREQGVDDPENAKLPPIELLQEKAKHTDISKVIIDKEAKTVYLEDAEMSLDVGAIAKGYATEQVVRDLIAKGYDHAMLSVGGNVRAIGSKPQDEPWKVGVQNPDLESEQTNLYILNLKGLSLVTSGDYQRYYTVDGVKYHHIIDPDTLMPADYFTAVSIVTEDSGMADALSTSVYNMPYEQGLALIESLPDTEAIWILKNGEHRFSSGFQAFLTGN